MKRNLTPIASGVALFMMSAAVSGCATAPPQTVYKTVEVKIPVPVPCHVDAVERPAFALDAVDKSQSLYPKGAAAMAEIQQRQAYEGKLEAAAKGCQ